MSQFTVMQEPACQANAMKNKILYITRQVTFLTACILTLHGCSGSGDSGNSPAPDIPPVTQEPGVSPASNNPPVLQGPGNQTHTEGNSVQLNITASDADGDTLTFTATGLPAGLTIDSSSGAISGTILPTAVAASPYTVEVSVNDGQVTTSTLFQWSIDAAMALVPGAKFVAPGGSDSNDGSESAPWATLDHAFSQLTVGDTLYLRGGSYQESGLRINVTGSATNPVLIRNYPGETPVIDGGLQAFRQPGNNDWELVDPAINLYRSTAQYVLKDIAGKFESQGQLYSLSRYENMADITATNEFVSTGPRYVGPGVYYAAAEDRIYIRLQPSSPQSLNGVTYNLPTNTDPRQLKIYLNDETTAIRLSSSAAYITFTGIDLAQHYHGFRLSGANHITLSNLTITMNYTAMLLENGSHHVLVDNIIVNALFPPWVAWTDMKGSDGQHQPVPTIKPAGLSGTDTPLMHDIEIRNCLFNRVFDGHSFDGYNINIHNNTYNVVDDMAQVGTNSYNVEIHHNRIIGPGISHNGRGDSSPAPGTKYIHHNIIDSTQPILWGRHDPAGILRSSYTGWHGQKPFPTHTGSGPGNGDPWKIYHNTVLYDGTRLSGGAGHELWKAVNSTGEAHEVYNNIFIQTTDNPIVDDQSTVDGLQIYDGNLYYRATGNSPLFKDIADSSGKSSYDSLAAFLASPTFIESSNLYQPGWDVSSIEADPQLLDPANGNYRPATGSPAASGAIDISSQGFPGLKGDVFRGATDPGGAEALGRPTGL